jgi:hypothetical protein
MAIGESLIEDEANLEDRMGVAMIRTDDDENSQTRIRYIDVE